MIEFDVGEKWNDHKDVAERLALIVGGEKVPELGPPFFHGDSDDGYWQLDRGQNWFLMKAGDRRYVLWTLFIDKETGELADALRGLTLFLTNFIFQ